MAYQGVYMARRPAVARAPFTPTQKGFDMSISSITAGLPVDQSLLTTAQPKPVATVNDPDQDGDVDAAGQTDNDGGHSINIHA